MRDDVTFAVLRRTDELEELAEAWPGLWTEDPGATPFQSPEWLLPWWRQFGGELRTVTIRRDGALIGLLPFYVYREPGSGVRKLMLMGVGTTDYLDGVFAPACIVEHVRRGLEVLWEDGGWDLLSVSQLREGSKLLEALEGIGEGSVCRVSSESCSQMKAVTMAVLPQKIRRNAMYYRNRAMRAGILEYVMAQGADVNPAFAALERLHTERWESSGESGVLADARVRAWHREALPLLERRGLLRLGCLRLDGETIAILYSMVDPVGRPARTQYVYLPGYSVRHAELRPGTLLLALAIEQAAREGVQTIDMLRGNEAYKQIWHVEPVPTYRFELPREPNAVAATEEIAA